MKKLYFLLFLSFPYNAYSIIGGIDVDQDNELSKSVVAIQMVERTSQGKKNHYKGTGVIIGQDLILTAGHNFFYLTDPTLSKVIFSTTSSWTKNSNKQIYIQVNKAHVLPGFSQGPLGTSNDLAIIQLKSQIPDTYKPIEFNADGTTPPKLAEEAIILGYGHGKLNSNANSHYRLRKIKLPMARWSKSNEFDSEKLWVSAKRGSISSGDSGGPILFKRKGNYILYGIAIHNRYDKCVIERLCEPQSAFTNLSYFKNWINEVINNQ